MEELLTFDDVLIQPGYSDVLTRRDCDVSWSIRDMTFQCPVIPANMDSISGRQMCYFMHSKGGLGILHRYYADLDEYTYLISDWMKKTNYPLGVSVGSVYNDKDRIDKVVSTIEENSGGRVILCVDIAHGHSIHMKDTLKYLREKLPKIAIIAGNVCTAVGAGDLIEWGADMVKVGVGPGSVCTTREKTGCGSPQLTAIIRTAQYPIIADGGITKPGDAAKALAAGADAIMVGGMLAGSDKSEAIVKYASDENPDVIFRGMASKEARQNFNGSYANAEGISITVPILGEGSTEYIVNNIVEGVKSSMSYVGAKNLTEFVNKSLFQKVSNSTRRENSPHYNQF